MRTMMIPMTVLALMAGAPAAAQPFNYGYDDRSWDGGADRGWASPAEVEYSRQRALEERREWQIAQRYGNKRDVREERREYERAHREYREDARDYARARGRDWQRGQSYVWNRPDPREGGYYADNYYRSGDYYRPRPLGVNDRIYRGRDNRYYCRRSDGTTGLVVGAISGGVLGNVIAPGGSKTIGSIIGGSLGAVLGSSIDRNSVTCR
jgi:hypothetical protein